MWVALWMTIAVLAVGAVLWVIKIRLELDRQRPGYEEFPLSPEQKRKEADAGTIIMIVMIAGL